MYSACFVFMYTDSFISKHPVGRCVSQNRLAYAMETSNAKSQWLNSANIYFLCMSTYFWRFSFPLMSLPNQLGFPWWCLWEKNTWRSAPALNYCSPKSPTSLPLIFHWPKHFLWPRLRSRGHVAGSRELESLLHISLPQVDRSHFIVKETEAKTGEVTYQSPHR